MNNDFPNSGNSGSGTYVTRFVPVFLLVALLLVTLLVPGRAEGNGVIADEEDDDDGWLSSSVKAGFESDVNRLRTQIKIRKL